MHKEILGRFRNASSSEEQAKIFSALIDFVEQTDKISTREEIFRSALLEFPYRQNAEAMDSLSDGCGQLVSLSMCSQIIKEISFDNQTESTISKLPTPSIFQACLTTIHRQLLSAIQPTVEDKDANQFVKMILLFPQIISNAAHHLKLHAPSWASPSVFFPLLVASTSIVDSHYRFSLLKGMLRSGKSDFVAMGLKGMHPLRSSQSLTKLSPRETANLASSILQQSLSTINSIPNGNAIETCQQILKLSSQEHQEVFVQHVVFSRNFSTQNSEMMIPFIIQLLERCDSLYGHLNDIAEIWSQWTFVHQTEAKQQHYVSKILLSGLSKLEVTQDSGDSLTMALLQGVTHRLESFFPPIRKDGLQIAQALAKQLGQVIQFDELKEEQVEVSIKKQIEPFPPVHEPEKIQKRFKKKRKPKWYKSRQLDPDADYESDNEDEQKDDGTQSSSSYSHDDNDSIEWDDELVPYDLNDDEEDLLETPKPLHLLECLELLRTTENDDHAYSNHEIALKCLPELIQARPDNLPDVAVSLMLQLLRMENKFNIAGFSDMRQNSITSLLIQEPLLVGQHLIDEVFADGCLADRLNIFAALQEAAYELSGGKLLDELQIKRSKQKLDSRSAQVDSTSLAIDRIADNHLARIQKKTRQKRSRPVLPSSIENRFHSVAPIWFYSVVSNFIKHKENEALWRGSIGSILLANLFRTLATIVEFSGMYSSQVLGKDLFDLVWTFRSADVAEVRMSVLVSIATSFAMLPSEKFAAFFQNGDMSALPQVMNEISERDPDKGCRTLAMTISKSLGEVMRDSLFWSL